MKQSFITILIILSLAVFASSGLAKDDNTLWEKEFVLALQKGKALLDRKAGGLGYTLSQEEREEKILAKAIRKAMDLKAPPCEAMKIAVDLKYKPYSVIRNIFGSGGEVDLDQMCMCATEKGVKKQIIAQAAREATYGGKPVYAPDEVTQSQCLREIGLGFSGFAPPEDIPPPPPPPPPVSPSTPI